MKNLLRQIAGLIVAQEPAQYILLDSVPAAGEIAFMLGGEWDGCNGVVMPKVDEVAVNTAVKLLETAWCYQGASVAVLNQLKTDEFLRRYALGERNFINANLRCAELSFLSLSAINLSRSKLSLANLSGSNLTKADLTAADIQDANLADTNLSQSRLFRANLSRANLLRANLKGADLSHVCLCDANLSQADLRGANLSQADLSGADLTGAFFDDTL
ncbi:MAG: pentapeptide repeat-containing protein [Mojavia pulchra JT2-VF2]|jgi:uncharacterized protein YjbI with pentapeptide repeats|uniref:Pentapeptide repeat-containing protein n=1 Tax=Mojavia pulchra JT2-VF2 TaxID=287848 RepID=A0A951PUZ9_9NOST|nr:pentapeptide repeat-containing protein [Mojavia pulchra JT2-VF2]